MVTLPLFFMVLALVLLLLAGFNVSYPQHPAPPRFSLGWLGMFFWLLSIVVR